MAKKKAAHSNEKPGNNNRPEPKPFVMRRQHPGESTGEYEAMTARAKEKFKRAGKARAIKGMLGEDRLAEVPSG